MKIILDEFDSRRMERLNATIETNSAMADALLSFVETNPKYVTMKQIQEFVDEYEMLPELAYAMIISTAMGLDIHKNNAHQELFQDYIEPSIRCQNPDDYTNDPFLRNIKITGKQNGKLSLRKIKIQPAEAFVFSDNITTSTFREYPQIGFFKEEFECPAIVSADGKIIAAADPYTINTSQSEIENAQGNVIYYGLEIGYLAYMASNKRSVEKITIYEKSQELIDIFKSEILPQIPNADKIEIVCSDYKTKTALPKLREAVFNELYKIYKSGEKVAADGERIVTSYREITDIISDKELQKLLISNS